MWDRRVDRPMFAVVLAAIWLGLVTGFGTDFPRYLAEVPPPPLLVHVHAVVFFGWMVFLTTQMLLIRGDRPDLHRKMGKVGIGLVGLLAILGPATALTVRARQIGLPNARPQFLALNFADILAFVTLATAALVLRRDAPAHKRLMLLSAIALSDPGFARLEIFLFGRPVQPVAWFFLTFYGNLALIGFMLAWDLARSRRIHPALGLGALWLLLTELAATWLNFDPGWKALASGLVKAWGYAG